MMKATTNANNSQVPRSTKDVIYTYFEERGVDRLRQASILHSYPCGFVAVSLRGEVELSGGEFGAWNSATKKAVEAYWRNKKVHDECVWVHETWINQLSI